ncbi:glycosyltransferase [Caulobacter sp. DWP3-1-3b2]|uniref:glycosyltransferase n=1 Tax=Caulobacter sp. DWP3-1-3b2 TaxID=2804643 RepID=UPI003CF5AF1C
MSTVAFTICAKNYLSRARVCLESIREQHPDTALRLFLSDEDDQGYQPLSEAFPVTLARTLNLPDWDDMVMRYDVTELSTAIKPACIARLFDEGFEKVVYLDPDTYVLAPMSAALEPLDLGTTDAVVTPHITESIRDDLRPSDGEMLQVGVFNLGFLALRRCEETRTFVSWWNERLRLGAVSDLAAGLFTDQKWCDLLPCFIGRTLILRHPGYNVAYWNLMHRPVARVGDQWTAAGEPLVFAHFSGYDPENPRLLSKHQSRFDASNVGQFAALAQIYGRKVLAASVSLPSYGYAYNVSPDGRPIPRILREIFRQAAPEGRLAETRPALAVAVAFAQEPEPRYAGLPGPVVTRVMHTAWLQDEVLRDTWNLNDEAHRWALARWFHATGARAAGVEDLAVSPPPEPGATTPSVAGLSARAVLRSALSRYEVLRPIYSRLPVDARQRIRAAATRMAFGGVVSRRGPRPQKIKTGLGAGASLIGYARAELGMGEHVRMTAAAFGAQGVPYSIVDVGRHIAARTEDNRFDAAIVDRPIHRANLFHVNADQLPEVRRRIGADFDGRINIVYPAWELSEFPDAWVGAFDEFEEIWAPSRFIQGAISTKVAKRVLHMPLAVQLAEGYEGWNRADFGLPAGDMIFLLHFDLASFATRKNPEGALVAFQRAFPKPTKGKNAPRLVIKTLSSMRFPAELESLRAAIGDRPDVTLITETLSASAIHGLVNCCDVLVSLHRSEGFGRAPAEAMAAGKAVVATAYSGNAEYMTPANSEAVPYTLVPVPPNAYPFGYNQVWAEPDLDAAAAMMRRLREEPERVRSLGEEARRYMIKHHSPIVIGELYKRRLIQLGVV